MILILIDRTTIKENPKAGQTSMQVRGNRSCTFSCDGGTIFKKEYESKIVITEEDYKGNKAGIIIDPDSYIDIMNNGLVSGGLNINYISPVETVYHHALPKWIFNYEKTTVECSNCKSKVVWNDIDIDYERFGEDGDEVRVETCPICQENNTFEDRKFEDINTVVKELKL